MVVRAFGISDICRYLIVLGCDWVCCVAFRYEVLVIDDDLYDCVLSF